MLDPKLLELVLKLAARQGSLAWEATADENVFQAPLTNFIITIRKAQFRYDIVHLISIVDNVGRTLQTIDERDIIEAHEIALLGGSPRKTMENIFESAKRKALGTDQAIQKILDELS